MKPYLWGIIVAVVLITVAIVVSLGLYYGTPPSEGRYLLEGLDSVPIPVTVKNKQIVVGSHVYGTLVKNNNLFLTDVGTATSIGHHKWRLTVGKETFTIALIRWCSHRPADEYEGKGILKFTASQIMFGIDFRNGQDTNAVMGALNVTSDHTLTMSLGGNVVAFPRVSANKERTIWKDESGTEVEFTRWC
jgi:hypothetical protein